jgi:hypothetical protein
MHRNAALARTTSRLARSAGGRCTSSGERRIRNTARVTNAKHSFAAIAGIKSNVPPTGAARRIAVKDENAGTTVMNVNGGTIYDPETVELLSAVLDDAWACLPPEQQASVSKTLLAERLLRAAARGERDPQCLRARALFAAAPQTFSAG